MAQLNKKLSYRMKVRDLLVLQNIFDELEELSEDEERVREKVDSMIDRAKASCSQEKIPVRRPLQATR